MRLFFLNSLKYYHFEKKTEIDGSISMCRLHLSGLTQGIPVTGSEGKLLNSMTHHSSHIQKEGEGSTHHHHAKDNLPKLLTGFVKKKKSARKTQSRHRKAPAFCDQISTEKSRRRLNMML